MHSMYDFQWCICSFAELGPTLRNRTRFYFEKRVHSMKHTNDIRTALIGDLPNDTLFSCVGAIYDQLSTFLETGLQNWRRHCMLMLICSFLAHWWPKHLKCPQSPDAFLWHAGIWVTKSSFLYDPISLSDWKSG